MHITDPERLSTLMSILAIAYTWMIRIGTWVTKIKPEIFKKNMGDMRKAYSEPDWRNLQMQFIHCVS